MGRDVGGLCAALVTVVAMAWSPATARAADTLSIQPAIDRGVSQLEAVQLPDGGFGTRLPVRDSAAAAEALRGARPDSAALPRVSEFLSAGSFDDVDSLARVALGAPSDRYAGALLAAQRDDGGFGLSQEYESDALDTALALRALTALGERDAARRAADRLLKFATAGVWGGDGGEEALTGEALLALGAYVTRYGSTIALDAALASATTWLSDRQQPDGGWSPASGLSVRRTALAVVALAPSPVAVARVSSGADALLAAQLPDGSWGDPYSSALAIRALHAASDAIERDRTTQLADLAVWARDLSANPQTVESGRSLTIKATITNAGRATASGATAAFFLDDPASGAEPVATVAVPDVELQGRTEVEATFSVDKPQGRARGYVVLRAPVGEDRDLANNTAFINVFVRTARHAYAPTRDWPRPGRDMQHSGATPNRLHPGIDPDPIWKAPADGGQIVAEGNVYYGEDGRITARDAKTGELRWQRGGSYLDDRYRPPIYNRGFIYTATEGQTGALNANTGEPPAYGVGGWGGDRPVFWVEIIPVEGAHDPVFMDMANAPFINSGQLKAGDDGMCHLWPYRDPTGSPWNEHVWEGISSYYPPGSNPGDGSLFFRHSCDGNPIAFSGDDSRAFFASGNWVSGFDPKDATGPNGEPMLPLFSAKLPGIVRAPMAPLVDSLNQVVVAGWEGTELKRDNYWTPKFSETGKGTVAAVDPATGAAYWSFTTDARVDGSPVEYKGTIVVVDRSGRVYALDQITGALKWTWMPAGYTPPEADQQGPSGQTLAVSGRYLYVPHPDGHVYTLDARDGSVLSSAMFPARPYDLAIDDTNNAIYVRTLDGFVGAYRTRELPDQCAPDPANLPPARGPIDRVSLNDDGSQLTGFGAADERPAMSADGSIVAYTREQPNFTSELRVNDLQTGATTVIPATQTLPGNVTRTNPSHPALSDDGRYLAFLARQSFNDTLFVLDRQTGVIEPLFKRPDGSPDFNVGLDGSVYARASYSWQNPGYAMAGDGKWFAVVLRTSLVAEDTDTAPDVYLVNRVTGERKLASRKRIASTYNEGNYNPSISRDGRYVAFTSDESISGTPVSPGLYDGNGPYVHVYDAATDSLTAATSPETGKVVNGSSPDISGDGRYVAFTSMAPTLYPPSMRETDPWWSGRSVDAFMWDRATGNVEFASPNDAGEHARYASIGKPAVSDDGQYVAFQSTGIFVKGVSFEQKAQIIGRDRAAGTTRQISHNDWGVSGNGESLAPVMSAEGNRVAFLSAAPDLVDEDTNGARDVFVYDRARAAAIGDPPDPPEPDLGNCPVAGEDPETYSDLSVTADDVDPGALEQGQPGAVEVTVHNEGEAPSEATTVRLYDGTAEAGTLLGEQALGELAAGASATLRFAWNPVGHAGRHTLTVAVDPDRQVFEQDVADDEVAAPVDVAAPQLDLALATDAPAYGADEDVGLDATVANRSIASRDVRLVMVLRDADGDAISTVHDGQVVVAADGTATVHAGWNTRDTTPGTYTVAARLLNAVGDEIATKTTTFEIRPDVAAGLALETDELAYGPQDTATIRALVSNRSGNAALSGAQVQLVLDAPGGAQLDAWNLPAGDIMQGRTATLTQEKALQDLEPGDYEVHATLRAEDGRELATAATQLDVRSSASTGAGVRGSLTAVPADQYRLSTATFRYALTNAGNADVAGATVRVRISDLTSGQTLKTLDEPRTITRGEPVTGSLATVADMAENRDYQASLHLVLADGTERPLDRAIIHVLPAPFTFGASFDATPRNRVLIWACDRADETAARAALGDTYATYVPDRSDPRYASEPGCDRYAAEEQRRFTRLLRSGDYNQFWLLGGHHPLEGTAFDELAARVISGDGVLMAGTHPASELNQGANASPFGAAYAGTLPPDTYTLAFAADSTFAGLDAQVTGKPTKLTTARATGVATAVAGKKTAISGTFNQFGAGKAIFLGVAPSEFVAPARAADVLREAARTLLPAADATRTGGMARLQLFVEGTAPGSPLELLTQLPAGMGVPQPPADATLAGGLLTLPFETSGTQRRERSVWLKLPAGGSSATTSTSVRYRDPADGQAKSYGDPATATIAIAQSRRTTADAALAALGAIGVSTPADQSKLQAIKDDVAATDAASTDVAVLKARLQALAGDVGLLERSSWTGTTPAWNAVARLVTYAEYDYHRAGGE